MQGPYLAAVTVGHTVISAGLILVVITIACLVMLGRSERGSVLWAVIFLILGVMLAAAFPVLAGDINRFFAGLT